MSEVRCAYCMKYCKSLNDKYKCKECDNEFIKIVLDMQKRYDKDGKSIATK